MRIWKQFQRVFDELFLKADPYLSINICPGTGIANSDGIPGTLGCIAYSDDLKAPVLLSNYHVLFGGNSDENRDIWCIKSEPEQKFICIAKSLMGKIGGVYYKGDYTFIDCALGTLLQPVLTPKKSFYKTNYPVIRIKGVSEAVVNEPVIKIGSATKYSEGRVVDIRYSTVCRVNGIVYPALNQILIQSSNNQKFSDKGDSGAVILNKENKIIGLLWSVSERGEGIACPILPVMEELNISLPDAQTYKGGRIKQIINNLLQTK